MGARKLVPVEPGGVEMVDRMPVELAGVEREIRCWEETLRSSLRRESIDKDTLTDEIRAHKARGDMEYFAMAAKLLALKRLCEHGDFAARLDALGIHPRLAQRAMAAAIRILGPDLSGTPRIALAGAGPSKLAELMSLDDDELDQIVQGEEIGGITLDKIDRMSVRELRERVRKLERKVEDVKAAHDEDAAAAAELKRENQRLRRQWSAQPLDERIAERCRDLDQIVTAIEAQLGDYGAAAATTGLAGAVQSLYDECEQCDPQQRKRVEVQIKAAIERLQLSVRALHDQYVVG